MFLRMGGDVSGTLLILLLLISSLTAKARQWLRKKRGNFVPLEYFPQVPLPTLDMPRKYLLFDLQLSRAAKQLENYRKYSYKSNCLSDSGLVRKL